MYAILLGLLPAVQLTSSFPFSPFTQPERHPAQSPLNPDSDDHNPLPKPHLTRLDEDFTFDPLFHLPGISPYFDAPGFGLSHNSPLGCKVTAATYLIRHTAIYANDDEYEEYIKPFLSRLAEHRNDKSKDKTGWTGPLEFLNRWSSPIDEDHLEDITPSGAVDAVEVGTHLLARYPDLVTTVRKILADKKARTYDTAKAFVRAFPQANDIEVVRVHRSDNHSLDIIDPHKTCERFSKSPGAKEMLDFVSVYAEHVSERLKQYAPFKLRDNDVIGLQQLCGYESGINRRRSDICGVFTDAEWMAYEYAYDLKYAHMVGPLNPLSPYLGFPWLRAQEKLFERFEHEDGDGDGWPSKQRLFLAFTHREVPPFVATALGIFNSSSAAREEFPTDHINWTRAWKMSDLIPFLGHVGLERMRCDARSGMEGDFVRVISNSAPRPIPRCQHGPGGSCPGREFQEFIREGEERYGDFHGVCDEKEEER
ncbi:histidine acid phosphatase-like protein [Aulographum hederae CBS 113979]|uniref:Histidine acid phosphatase-like protein n=1 Tax=Aulographum hederae CBS 113979 TaxID=1176131 RepID=A0A6G1H5N1_9PEZI|nr:histidine acid phosphatase-like protein [Aulographum hederae CBS 113979]